MSSGVMQLYHEKYDKETLEMHETTRMQFNLSRLHVQWTVRT